MWYWLLIHNIILCYCYWRSQNNNSLYLALSLSLFPHFCPTAFFIACLHFHTIRMNNMELHWQTIVASSHIIVISVNVNGWWLSASLRKWLTQTYLFAGLDRTKHILYTVIAFGRTRRKIKKNTKKNILIFCGFIICIEMGYHRRGDFSICQLTSLASNVARSTKNHRQTSDASISFVDCYSVMPFSSVGS